jgi:hypothetical protein
VHDTRKIFGGDGSGNKTRCPAVTWAVYNYLQPSLRMIFNAEVLVMAHRQLQGAIRTVVILSLRQRREKSKLW